MSRALGSGWRNDRGQQNNGSLFVAHMVIILWVCCTDGKASNGKERSRNIQIKLQNLCNSYQKLWKNALIQLKSRTKMFPVLLTPFLCCLSVLMKTSWLIIFQLEPVRLLNSTAHSKFLPPPAPPSLLSHDAANRSVVLLIPGSPWWRTNSEAGRVTSFVCACQLAYSCLEWISLLFTAQKDPSLQLPPLGWKLIQTFHRPRPHWVTPPAVKALNPSEWVNWIHLLNFELGEV